MVNFRRENSNYSYYLLYSFSYIKKKFGYNTKFLEVRSLLTKVEFWLSVYNLATRYCIHFRADNVMDGTPNVYLV